MRTVSIAMLVLWAAVGCGGKKKGTDKFDEVLVEMEALSTKLCACPDAECADKVQAEVLALRKTFKERLGKDAKPSDEQNQRGRASEKRIGECRAKFTTQSFDQVLDRLEDLKTRMCACTDPSCADKVQDEWGAYRKSMKDRLGKDAKPTDAQDKRGLALDVEMKACREKFTGSGSGSAAPTAEKPPI
ncbi:MAG: hypothetical protein JWP01_1563 [Myxococcales bacterium]|nr:hypothetical protein [Myxococcales bacterium]